MGYVILLWHSLSVPYNYFVDIDDCESAPCLNGGTCQDGVNAFTCKCVSGFTGYFCEISKYLHSLCTFIIILAPQQLSNLHT